MPGYRTQTQLYHCCSKLSCDRRGFWTKSLLTSLGSIFRRVDANRFFATIYKDGKDVVRATVFIGSGFGSGIHYLQGQSMESNSYNESLSVDADDQALYLTPQGMAAYGRRDQKLSQEDAAEMLWDIVIAPPLCRLLLRHLG